MELAPKAGKLESYTKPQTTLNEAMIAAFGKVFPYWLEAGRLVRVEADGLTTEQKSQLYTLFEERGMI